MEAIPNQNSPQPAQTSPAAPNPLSLHLLIRDRKKVIFDDEIKAVTSINEKGVFDILPEHENFISLNKQYIIIHKKDGQEQRLDIENGVLKVNTNQIQIYINLLAPTPFK